MIDIFRIGVSIWMKNDISPVIGTIQRDLAGLGGSVDRTIARFGALRMAALGALGGLGAVPAGTLVPECENVRRIAPAMAAPSAMVAMFETTSKALRDARARGMPAAGFPERPRGAGGMVARQAVRLPVGHDLPRMTAGAAVDRANVVMDRSLVSTLARLLAHDGETARARDVTAAVMGRPGRPADAAAWAVSPTRRLGTSPMDESTVASLVRRGGAVAPGVQTAVSQGMPVLMRELGDWVRAARVGVREAGAVTSGLLSLDAGLGRLSSLFDHTDWSLKFARVARQLRAVAVAAHGIGDWGVPRSAPGAVVAEPQTGAALYVHVLNAHEIGNAAGEAVNRGLRVPAAVAPSLPAPATMPWAPGLIPAIP